jgi:hypothetical protein
MGACVDNCRVIHSTPHADAAVAAPPKRTLVMAVLAPFAAIGLMASPLLFDAVKHALGV